jgi:WD40 repeat protein
MVEVLETATGTSRAILAGPGGTISNLAFSADGRLLAASDSAGRVLVWEWEARRPLYPAPLQGPWYRLAFSPDGKRLAGADRDQVKLWDVASGQEVLLLRGARPRSMDGGFNPQLAWSADGRRLAAVNWDATIAVWDAGPNLAK